MEIKINGENFRVVKSEDGDRVTCIKELMDENITKIGDVGVLDLHYDRVYMDNGESFIYFPDYFATLIRNYTNEEMKKFM